MSTGRFSNSNSAGSGKKRRDKKQKAAMKASIYGLIWNPLIHTGNKHQQPRPTLLHKRLKQFVACAIGACPAFVSCRYIRVFCVLCARCIISFNHLSCAANASAGANYFGSLLFTVPIGHTELPRLTSSTPPHPSSRATICLRFDA